VRTRGGLVVRHGAVSDAVSVRGFHATSVHRTLRELSRRLPPVEALVLIDAAIHAGLTTRHELVGPRRLRTLAELAAPAESPMETRLRWLLLQARLPRPQVQADIRNADGRFIGRADLYYPAARLVIEYDGANHRDRLVEDNRRQNLILNAGFRLLRFAAADIHQRPDVVTSQVRRALTPV
jgi:very-short-patch-repair endonuclease